MIIVFFGIYLIFLALIWGFFIVAKIHAYKFKDFSQNIEKITKLLLFALIFLSILGFFLIYNFNWSLYSVEISDINADNVSQENW